MDVAWGLLQSHVTHIHIGQGRGGSGRSMNLQLLHLECEVEATIDIAARLLNMRRADMEYKGVGVEVIPHPGK